MATTPTNVATPTAVRRLQRDLSDLSAENLPFVAAGPIGDGENILQWSATFQADAGLWKDIPVHVHIDFPVDYPLSPPVVGMKTRGLAHPNVFPCGYICLDMLNRPYQDVPYEGWSTAYSVSAVLMQLYGFLLADDTIDQQYGGCSVQRSDYGNCLTRQSALEQLRACACGMHDLPLSDQQSLAISTSSSASSSDTADGQQAMKTNSEHQCKSSPAVAASADLEELPAHILGSIVERLDHISATHLATAAGSSTYTGSVAQDYLSQINLFCFFDKSRHDDGHTLLGYPVDVTRFNDKRKVKSMSIAGYDYLSDRAFRDSGIRLTAWNRRFTDFLPLYLNPAHGQRALRLLPSIVDSSGGDIAFVFGKLMNGMLVDLSSDDGTSSNDRMMCDNAVQAFFHMHHMLLAVALAADRRVLEKARMEVKRFSSGETDKRYFPDLGVVLIYMLLVPAQAVPWSRFVRVFFRELLSRQVRWIDAGDDFFLPSCDKSDDYRINTHLAGARKSLRIVTMSAWFANCVARPRLATSELADIKQELDAANGQPKQETRDTFWSVFRSLARGARFSDYLNVIGVCPRPCPTHRATLARMLRQAVVDSESAQYHRPRHRSFNRTRYARFDQSDLDVYTGHDVQ